MAYELKIGGQTQGNYNSEQEAQQAYYQWALNSRANLGSQVEGTPESNVATINGNRYYVPLQDQNAIFSASTNKATQEQLNYLAGITGKSAADLSGYLNPDFLPITQNKPGGDVDPRLKASPFEGGKFTGVQGEASQYSQLDPRYQAPQSVLQAPKAGYPGTQTNTQQNQAYYPGFSQGQGSTVPGQTGHIDMGSQYGNQMVYNVPLANGTFYSGPASGLPPGTQIPNQQTQQQQSQLTGQLPSKTAPTQVPQISQNLSPGMKGDEVSNLQAYLLSQGYSIPSLENGSAQFGNYGPETKAAVEAWQRANGVNPTDPSHYGFFGPLSRAKMEELATQGDNLPDAFGSTDVGIDTTKVDALTGQFGFKLDPNLASRFAAEDPVEFVGKVFDKLYSKSGLPELKQEIGNYTKELALIRDAKNEEILAINENPWLTEGARVGKIRNIEAKYEGKLQIYADLLQYSQKTFDSGMDQARFVTQQALNTYNDMVDFQQDIYMKKMDAAAALAETKWKIENGVAGYENYREVQGGIFDLKNQKWVVAPKPGSGDSGLSPAQINSTINQIAGSFDNEPIVKNYNTALEGYQTLKSIGVNTKSPADDIAFIYGFAKIMDPNSVVREGEYATVQRYAQTWADTFGFKANRVFSNTNFLSPDAKQKMMNALSSKVGTLQTQYDNVYKSYQQRIEAAKGGGFNSLTDYSQAFPRETSGSYTPGSVIVNNGTYYLVGSDGESITPFKPLGSSL